MKNFLRKPEVRFKPEALFYARERKNRWKNVLISKKDQKPLFIASKPIFRKPEVQFTDRK